MPYDSDVPTGLGIRFVHIFEKNQTTLVIPRDFCHRTFWGEGRDMDWEGMRKEESESG